MLNPEMGMEKQEAMKKMEVLSLIEAARSSGLPWDYYLSQMYKRSSTSENSMDDNFINLTDIGKDTLRIGRNTRPNLILWSFQLGARINRIRKATRILWLDFLDHDFL